ncbi:uncharacterized protein Z518_09496 [Rhinocladiella mackenziei CBS 650.93]|uniref:NADH-ubiquinone oxidoreductase 17.8 kDa subunit n=1 Tax=Rhinocladiella mackenziei CBS 650.93 TaxID=1442369 RepID=A0A0D2I7E7_9EURO|nr:uncharacterized protein Z518_09496 [Rhinocladiella mackenziei CBS 650.93]KIX01769.1 hypothetical protein Z518_09496 [Rhinocladiella mackenziei CBS 650.93]
MSFVSRRVEAAARPLSRLIQHQARRYAGHEAGHGHGEAHHGESAFHVQGGSGNESFGAGFYLSVASIPFAILVYSIASSPGDNFASRLVKKYEASVEADKRANVIHTAMMEQVAADRQLFASSAGNETVPPFRNQESFNFGSPWNVSAGQGTADLTALAKFYEERNVRAEEERRQRLKKNNGHSVYD